MNAPRIAVLALACAALAPAAAQAAPPNSDRPAGAVELTATTAENGSPTDLSALLDLRETGPDHGVPRCLGETSFGRTAWAWIPAAGQARRLLVSATAQSGSTQTPDLALFPQEPITRDAADVREPGACDGRETLAGIAGDGGSALTGGARDGGPTALAEGARGDGSAAVTAVLRAGRPALVQVGWREGDADAPIVVTLAVDALDRRARPAGDDPAAAPAVELGAAAAVALGGATLGSGDPAQPACPAPATVWRRVTLPAAGVYAISAGEAARTLTAFADPLGGDSALACSDLADGPDLTLTPRVAGPGPLWIRIGADQVAGDPFSQLLVRGPFPDEATARQSARQPQQGPPAVPGRGGQPARPAGPTCVRARTPRLTIDAASLRARTPRLTIDAASLRALRSGRGRRLSGAVRQPCDRSRPRATRVTVTVASRTAGTAARRASGVARRPPRAVKARGVVRWSVTLRSRLAPGRHRIVVRALANGRPGGRAGRGGARAAKPRVLTTVRRTLAVPATSNRSAARR